MVIAYAVGTKIEKNKSGKRSREVRYVNSKLKDYKRLFLVDNAGNFMSNAYGGLDGFGNPKANSKEEAFEMIAQAVSNARRDRYERTKGPNVKSRPRKRPQLPDFDDGDFEVFGPLTATATKAMEDLQKLNELRKQLGWSNDDIIEANDPLMYMDDTQMAAHIATQLQNAQNDLEARKSSTVVDSDAELTGLDKHRLKLLRKLWKRLGRKEADIDAEFAALNGLPRAELMHKAYGMWMEGKQQYQELTGRKYDPKRKPKVKRSAREDGEEQPPKKPKRVKHSARPVTEAEHREYNELLAKDLFA